MNKYYSRIVEYFNQHVPQGVTEDALSSSVGAWLRTQYGPLRMVVQSIGEDGSHVLFSVRNIMTIPIHEKRKALMLISLINCKAVIGNFAVDEEDSELSFTIPYCLCDSDLSPKQFSHGFNLAMAMAVKYYAVFQKLFWSGLTPTEALESLSPDKDTECDSITVDKNDIPENYANVAIEEFIELLKEGPNSSKGRSKTQD